jgi:hypothetical protein
MRTVRAPAAPGRSRIYEKIISSALQARTYDSIAELVEDVKCECARLRLPYANHEIDQAITVMRERLQRDIGGNHDESRRAPAPTQQPAPHAEQHPAPIEFRRSPPGHAAIRPQHWIEELWRVPD